MLVSEQFREISKMVRLSGEAHRLVKNNLLTCYACYLVDPNFALKI